MRVSSFEAIARALNDAGARFIVVGGIAVAAHGYLRHTRDVDLVVELSPANVRKALEALAALGYQPRIPVSAAEFSDPAIRERWIAEKGMVVLNLFSDLHRETPIDIFVSEPFHFESEYGAASVRNLGTGLPIRIVSLPTLISMKRGAGRPQDLVDIDQLQLRSNTK